MPEFNTLEEAQEEIVRLLEVNTDLTNERDTLLENNNKLTAELNQSRERTQYYYNKVIQQFVPAAAETEDDDKEPVSCEDFARSLNII